MPDYMSATLSATKPAEEQQSAMADSTAIDSVATAETIPNDIKKEETNKAEAPATDKYELAMSRVNRTAHNMLTGKWNLVKVKEVFCPEEYAKNGKATCKFIIEFTEKTPFGYVLGAPKQHERTLANATLTHYTDMGWLIDNISDLKD